jgi:hypothetical protein
VRLGTEVVGGGGDGWLERLVLRTAGGEEETVAAQGLFLMIGARPRTDWLPPEIARDSRGFVLTGSDLSDGSGWPLERDPFMLETSMPGVFAAGDARSGAVKRVASAVGAGSIAIQQVHRLLATQRLQSPSDFVTHESRRPCAPRGAIGSLALRPRDGYLRRSPLAGAGPPALQHSHPPRKDSLDVDVSLSPLAPPPRTPRAPGSGEPGHGAAPLS